MQLTRHAQVRSRQRSIPSSVISAVYKYGTCRDVRGGACSYTLDRESLALAMDEFPTSFCGDLAKYMGVYIVVGDDERIITAARGKAGFGSH